MYYVCVGGCSKRVYVWVYAGLCVVYAWCMRRVRGVYAGCMRGERTPSRTLA